MSKSIAQEIAELPEAEREKVLEGVDPAGLLYDWGF